LSFNLNGWKQKIVAFASGLGAPGLFLISFLDSSVLSFPIINDLLLIQLSMQSPARMPLYALMATTGSVLGCIVLYFLARMGVEAYFHRKAGVFEAPLFGFVSAIMLARLFRYFGVGYLAVRYGSDAMPYLATHKLQVAALVIALVAVSYGLSRWILRHKPHHEPQD
jgi:membrane protein YqaA with SNARE-associated domain